ncbi:condensation domain-containing protein, partial [Serratia rubidaea]|uniref:condensation domain-containing protein n=1 Tax=Serratia rubidaea TaxID=61652 RepID=UPI0019BDD8CE
MQPLQRGGRELTSVQQAVWSEQILNPELPFYNIGLFFQIDGEFDAARLAVAINQVANRHDALRTMITRRGNTPVQYTLPTINVALPITDFSSDDSPQSRAHAYINSVFRTPFQLEGSLLWSMELARVSPDCVLWLLKFHHLISDGVSIALISRQITEEYRRSGQNSPAAEQADFSYADFIDEDAGYLSSARYPRDGDFWLQKLQPLPAPLFAAQKRTAGGEYFTDERQVLTLTRERFDALSACAARHHGTQFQAFMALVALCLSRLYQRDEIVIGIPVHNRGAARYKKVAGMFSSMVPVRIQVDGKRSFPELMNSIGAELRQAYRHQRFPLAELSRKLKIAQDGRQRLFDVSLSFDLFTFDLTLNGQPMNAVPLHHGFEQTALALRLCHYHQYGDIALDFTYNTGVLTDETVKHIVTRFNYLLTSVINDRGDTPVSALSWLGDAEREQLLYGWNDTARDWPDATLHQLFAEQAQRTPDAPAVEDERQQLSYAA